MPVRPPWPSSPSSSSPAPARRRAASPGAIDRAVGRAHRAPPSAVARRRRRRDRAPDRRHRRPPPATTRAAGSSPRRSWPPRRRSSRSTATGRSSSGTRRKRRPAAGRRRLPPQPVPDRQAQRGPDPGAARARDRRGRPRRRPAPSYTNNMVADASTAIFTVNADGAREDGLGLRARDRRPDTAPTRSLGRRFQKLAEPRSATSTTAGRSRAELYAPAALPRHPARRGRRRPTAREAWPWTTLKPADFSLPADPNGFQLPARDLTAGEVAALGIDRSRAGSGRDAHRPGRQDLLASSLRPLLPDETS